MEDAPDSQRLLPERLGRLREQVVGVLRSHRVNPSDAEDLAHAALIKVMKHWDEIQDRLDGGLLAYALRVASTERIHAHRQSWRHAPLEDEELFAEDGALSTDDVLAEWDLRARRVALLSELEPDHAAVLVARVVRGLSVRATAAELGIPEGTAKTRCRLACEAWASLCKKRGL
ncbi:MAG TPA: sigma-70 family RNA polymerase sigma factor [Polyangiaceae bacterium]|nr:sigma-70 family RNA polymerase sigma factor [Polyangiaceae bacterium]